MHRHNVFAAAMSLSGNLVVTGTVGGEVLVWSTRPFAPVRELGSPEHRGTISALALSPDGKEALVAPDWKAAVERWNVESATRGPALAAHSGRTTALAYAPGGALIASGGVDKLPSSGTADEGDDEVPALAPPSVRLWRDGALVHELT
ncbi:MAG: hypothetical protein AAGC55_17600, partial [Myxococcota bacterium]